MDDRLPKKNLTAKILALIMAVVLWVYVMNEQNPFIDTNVEVPLEVKNLSTSLSATDMPEQIRVKVRGPRSTIMMLPTEDVKAYIDVKGLSEGKNIVKVHVTVPTGLEVVEINPDKVTLRLETLVSKQVPLGVQVSGTPPKGIVFERAVPNVEKVTLHGPKNLLDTVTQAFVQVNVSEKNNDFFVKLPISPVNQNGKVVEGVHANPDFAEVKVSLTQSVVKKSVDVKVNLAGELTKGVELKQITSNPSKVEVSGSEALVEKMDAVFTEPISVTNIEKDTDIEVKLQTKEGITVDKKTVKVHISVSK